MAAITSEVLLHIFKMVDPLEMVRIMTVCKTWLTILIEHRSLWRELALSDIYHPRIGWDIRPLVFFDKMSGSRLREVSMSIKSVPEPKDFIKILGKSSRTLRVIHLEPAWAAGLHYPEYRRLERLLAERLFDFPESTDYRTGKSDSDVLVSLTSSSQDADESTFTPNFRALKVFWMVDLPASPRFNLLVLNGLVSLSISDSCRLLHSVWRDILERPSKTLKHLSIHLWRDPTEASEPSTLLFPKLEVLSVDYSPDTQFPSWMIIPASSTLVFQDCSPYSIPSVSKLWIESDALLKNDRMILNHALARICPELVELRIKPSRTWVLARRELRDLIVMLRERDALVKAGTQVQGISMTPIKTLIIPFPYFTDITRWLENDPVFQQRYQSYQQEYQSSWDDDWMPQLRCYVEEIIDLYSIDWGIEIEI